MMRKKLATLVALGMVLQHIRAEKFNCTVNTNGDQTIYTITYSHAPDIDMSGCHFFWMNGTNFTIADNSRLIPPVLKSNISSLTTSQCVESIVSKQECYSKTTGMIDYTVHCMVTCPEMNFNHGEKGGELIWIAVGVIVLACLAVLLVILYRKFGDRIWRRSSCTQFGGLYTTVKIQNTVPNPVDV